MLIGKVAGHAGMMAPMSFLLASLLATLTAFTYAELSARFPVSAGEAVYVKEGLGVWWLPGLVGWLIIVAGSVSSAAILRGFAGYLSVFVDVPTDCPQRDERMGWTGDAQVFAPTACFNMDASGFFIK